MNDNENAVRDVVEGSGVQTPGRVWMMLGASGLLGMAAIFNALAMPGSEEGANFRVVMLFSAGVLTAVVGSWLAVWGGAVARDGAGRWGAVIVGLVNVLGAVLVVF